MEVRINASFGDGGENSDYQLIDEKEVKATDDEKYTLKVVAYDSWISYYVNDTLIASTGDYTLQKTTKDRVLF